MTHLLFASDFDGTILPSDAAAGEIRWHPAARALFRRLARTDVALAVFSGRDPEELCAASDGIPCWVVASYGRYIRASTGEVIRDATPLVVTDAPWIAEVHHWGGVVERKRHGIAVHWRMSSRLTSQHAVVRAFRTWARAQGLRVLEGGTYSEAIVRGPAKLAALRLLLAKTGAARVIYAGDGRSDLAAARFAACHGDGFYIGSSSSALDRAGITVVPTIDELWRVAARYV
jgi:trehalose 6-phosphate synthase/phosphatase